MRGGQRNIIRFSVTTSQNQRKINKEGDRTLSLEKVISCLVIALEGKKTQDTTKYFSNTVLCHSCEAAQLKVQERGQKREG